MEIIDTIIIGAGQAGLSVARYLKEHGVPYIILEKESEVGFSWAHRYDSLILDSFAKYSQLEGFPFSGDDKRQPSKDEVSEYLQAFARHFDINPVFDTEVSSIQKENKGENSIFIVKTSRGVYRARSVVLATGPFHSPYIPLYAKNLPKDIYQIHTKEYKNSSSLPPGTALIIGGGNSGSEIAKELAESGREVLFSYKGILKSVTSSPATQWIAYRLGVAHIPQSSLLGRLVRYYTKGKLIGMDIGKLLKNPKVISIGEVIDITQEGRVVSMRGTWADFRTVIWATGYKSDFSIIHIPEFEPSLQERGVTNVERLYVLNIRWQYSKSSSHLAGISRDAKYIAQQISNNKK